MEDFGALVARLKRLFAPADVVPLQFRAAPAAAMKDGLGWAVPNVTVAQNGTLVVTHPLGRVPVGVALLDNGANAPSRIQVTARSSTSVTIKPLDAALSAALIRIF